MRFSYVLPDPVSYRDWAEFAFPKNAKGTKLALGVFTKESLA